MKAEVKTKTKSKKSELPIFFGRIVSFNNSLKLYHWSVTGKASYAIHIAIDQALAGLGDIADRLIETALVTEGELDIVIPETTSPKDIAKHIEGFYQYVETERDLLKEAFTQGIIDDLEENLIQLLYRIKRLQ